MVKPEKIKGTVWEEIDESDVSLDKKYLEENFCRQI
jgi:hypothetical protein